MASINIFRLFGIQVIWIVPTVIQVDLPAVIGNLPDGIRVEQLEIICDKVGSIKYELLITLVIC